MTSVLRGLLALLAAAPVLAACGRVGPIHPPGPQERIVYPRTYPAPRPTQGAQQVSPPSAATPSVSPNLVMPGN